MSDGPTDASGGPDRKTVSLEKKALRRRRRAARAAAFATNWKELLARREKATDLRMPNVIGLGAARCGTTTLFQSFKHNPQIFTPAVKELTYFARKHLEANPRGWSPEEYMLFFDDWTDEPLAAEVSPQYLHDPDAIRRIRDAIPEARLIVQVRDPVRRFVSHFHRHAAYHGLDRVDDYAREALAGRGGDLTIRRKFTHPVVAFQQSFFAAAVRHVLELFPAEQVAMIHLDHLSNAPGPVERMLAAFLGVEVTLGDRVANTSARIEGAERRDDRLSPDFADQLSELFAEDYGQTLDIYRSLAHTPLRFDAPDISVDALGEAP